MRLVESWFAAREKKLAAGEEMMLGTGSPSGSPVYCRDLEDTRGHAQSSRIDR